MPIKKSTNPIKDKNPQPKITMPKSNADDLEIAMLVKLMVENINDKHIKLIKASLKLTAIYFLGDFI